ncbi:hypothetical protein FF38_02179 [Lucilia cuprina]|uniref:Enoyl-CoA hydratase domain-containing protein 3, mitochondrial n=1 Tax=Lucilia cuprina TaxID=7375 RepID=A0A0L0BY43_LUCCU|nr:hypothetical protein FF38_02179 [Lucilia cuprina]
MLRHFRFLLNTPFTTTTNKLPLTNICAAMSTSSASNKYCQITESNGVREIILNDAKTRNALSLRMMDEILEGLPKTWHDTNLRCIVLSSTGPVWSAGHDLKELAPECGVQQHTAIFEKLTNIIYNIRKAPVPVIAKVNGIVAAGGVQLVASCDIVVCSAKSSFITPSANFGVFASTPAVAMSRIMPHSKCLDMLMTGHPITAEDAYKIGLASRVVADEELNNEINKIVNAIKNKSRTVLALGKEFFYQQLELPLEEAYKKGTKKMTENLQLEDSKEGIRGFMEKRKPVWSHLYKINKISTSKMLKIITKLNKPQTVPQIFNAALHISSTREAAQTYTKVTQSNGIREICLNEPKTRNSLSMGMMNSILEALTSGWENKELRCIVLSAKGPVWSAGHNLKELIPGSEQNCQKEVFQKLSDIILNIYKAPVPVIAKVNGLAAAAGCQLVASCDIIIASEKSNFSTPGANFGVFCSTPGIAISRVMARPQSAYMLMTGLPITAQEAFTAGLVSRVVPEAELETEMQKVTDAIKHKSRTVIALGKEFYYKQLNLSIEDAYKLGSEKMLENLSLNDCQEGLRSFVEKRKAQWKHE